MLLAFVLGVSLCAGQVETPTPSSGKAALLPPEPAQDDKKDKDKDATPQERTHFLRAFLKAYVDEFKKKDDSGDDSTPPARRALPEPWSSPPFPGHEFQGYPLIGVPASTDTYPFMKAFYDCTAGTPFGECVKESKIKVDGWLVGSYNFSTLRNSNLPSSYWIVPNRAELDQGVIRIARDMDTVQTDHIDWGFRSTHLYGIDYRYTTAGGWLSDQLLRNNRLYGYDPTEQYFDLYIPYVAQGMIIRVGRWIACPDIETQYGPDNYMGSHSLLFTYDSYTQTGVMLTFKLSDQLMVQGAIHAGTDMAPWYPGATATGFFGIRWVASDNNNAVYTCLNNINDARFRRLEIDGQTAGHDNFNYLVSTWEHRFNENVHTKTEAYFMWQRDAYVGGTVSVGPPQSFGGGGGAGAFIPGYSLNYGLVNFTMFGLGKKDYLTVRNEIWNDPQGERTGYRSLFSSHTIGWTHHFSSVFQIRPEIGFYHSYNERAFDLGATRNMLMGGFDAIWRF
jgi:Putative beta-barrel porin-2, OmpL-like. bbp2